MTTGSLDTGFSFFIDRAPVHRSSELSTGALVSLQGCQHTGCIRAMSFDANSTFFAVSGDDKLVLVWDVATWNVRASLRHVKKVSALVFTPSQLFVADRFGDVVAFPLPANLAEANAVELKEEPRSSFGHFSQVTSMIQGGSIDRPVLITGDVDTRIRVCRFPHTFDIVSMCLGNEKCVFILVFTYVWCLSRSLCLILDADSSRRW
jgi:WD40 repeat protein